MRRINSILGPGLVLLVMITVLLLLILYYRNTGGQVLVILAISAIVLVFAGVIYFLFSIYFPLLNLKKKLQELAKGEATDMTETGTTLEFRQIDAAVGAHLNRIGQISDIAEQLSKGNIETDFTPLGDRDELGHAINRMKKSILLTNLEMEKRRKTDEQQNWLSHGIAKFGELLRDFDQHTAEISFRFIRELVAYTDMEAGGLFVLTGGLDNPVYKLMGAWAFDREKQLHKEFSPGEGLVGRCAVEKQSIVITDVPDDYIRIRSGMGEDKPSTIILVPISMDDQVLGVIELATFSIVKPYKIEFLTSLGKSIASSVSKVTLT